MKELQSCFQTGEVAWKEARRSPSWSRAVKERVKLTFPSQLKQCTGNAGKQCAGGMPSTSCFAGRGFK